LHKRRRWWHAPNEEEGKVGVFGMVLQDLVYELLVVVDVVVEAFHVPTVALTPPKA
jgi:hypothetical protein